MLNFNGGAWSGVHRLGLEWNGWARIGYKSQTEFQSGFYFGLVLWELFVDIDGRGVERTARARM